MLLSLLTCDVNLRTVPLRDVLGFSTLQSACAFARASRSSSSSGAIPGAGRRGDPCTWTKAGGGLQQQPAEQETRRLEKAV